MRSNKKHQADAGAYSEAYSYIPLFKVVHTMLCNAHGIYLTTHTVEDTCRRLNAPHVTKLLNGRIPPNRVISRPSSPKGRDQGTASRTISSVVSRSWTALPPGTLFFKVGQGLQTVVGYVKRRPFNVRHITVICATTGPAMSRDPFYPISHQSRSSSRLAGGDGQLSGL